MSLVDLKGFRPQAFTTSLPMSRSVWEPERVWPARIPPQIDEDKEKLGRQAFKHH
jgi:hypothetical protein